MIPCICMIWCVTKICYSNTPSRKDRQAGSGHSLATSTFTRESSRSSSPHSVRSAPRSSSPHSVRSTPRSISPHSVGSFPQFVSPCSVQSLPVTNSSRGRPNLTFRLNKSGARSAILSHLDGGRGKGLDTQEKNTMLSHLDGGRGKRLDTRERSAPGIVWISLTFLFLYPKLCCA